MRRKITVLINDNHKELYTSENISGITLESTLTVESVTIFWDYNNVVKGENDTFTHHTNKVVVPEGYWTSDMIAGIRDKYAIYVSDSYYDVIAQLFMERNGNGGFSVYSSHAGYNINLGNFGTLLGFDENTDVPPRTRMLSKNPTDINRGLRYVTVGCDLVDNSLNTDMDGRRSDVIVTVPVPQDADLKRAVTTVSGPAEGVRLQNGCFNRITFNVNTNIGTVGVGSILLELIIDDK